MLIGNHNIPEVGFPQPFQCVLLVAPHGNLFFRAFTVNTYILNVTPMSIPYLADTTLTSDVELLILLNLIGSKSRAYNLFSHA